MSTATQTQPQIQITEKAAKQIRRIMDDDSIQETGGLRVSVKGGGCSGLMYNLTFENVPKPTDKIFESHNIKLFVDLKSYLYLVGTELDYSGGLNGKGFVFSNPNAARTCGCGTSFSA